MDGFMMDFCIIIKMNYGSIEGKQHGSNFMSTLSQM